MNSRITSKQREKKDANTIEKSYANYSNCSHYQMLLQYTHK